MGVCDPFRQKTRTSLADMLYSNIKYSDDKYFVTISRISEWPNDTSPPANVDSVLSDTEFYRGIIGCKQINPDDISLVIRRVDWSPGTVYNTYRDYTDLFDDDSPSNFYVLVDEARVYKCIDNNYNTISSVAPTHTDSQIRTLSDGYRWKFMYQIPESKRKFLTKSYSDSIGYMPVEYIENVEDNDERILQWNVQQQAIDGSIDFVELNKSVRDQIISDRVVFYKPENQISQSATAGTSSIVISSPNIVYSNGYYDGMVLKIESGLGQGQQRIISSYAAGSNSATVTIETPLNVGVTSGTGSDRSLFSIQPQIKIVGDGYASNNSLNTQFNRADFTVTFGDEYLSGFTGSKYLDTIEIVDSGKEYTFGQIEIIRGLTSIPGSNADMSVLAKAIMSPPGGHGSNPVKELGCNALMIIENFDQDEDNLLTISNDYRQFALLKNPLLHRKIVNLNLVESGNSDDYAAGDIVSLGTASGEVIEWFAGITGITCTSNLYLKSDYVNNFKIGLTLSDGKTINQVGYKTIAGTEGHNTLDVKITPYDATFDPEGADFVRGQFVQSVGNGSTAGDNVYPTYSYGKVYKWQPDLATNLIGSLYLEDYHGPFNIGEFVNKWYIGNTGYSNKIGKISEIAYRDFNSNSIYTQSYNLELFYNGANIFTDSSLTADSLITSLSGTTEMSKGYLIDWVPATGSTSANAIVNGVWGTFATGHTIKYGNSYSATINNIIRHPDIKYHSGELIHIQNIRPVSRSNEQREEIKLVINF